MNAFPVSDQVDIPDINDASLVTPVGEKLQSEERSTNKKGSTGCIRKNCIRIRLGLKIDKICSCMPL
jgi:hypothetical protein